MSPDTKSRSGLVKASLAVVVLAALAAGAYWILSKRPAQAPEPAPVEAIGPKHEVIGKSVQGRNIDAYIYGTGPKRIIFVGGIHGGYEWNSVLLAYDFMDYLAENSEAVPAGLSVAVIPDANPDGVFKIIGKEGRFTAADVPLAANEAAGRVNANGVDLNRNFGCHWQPQGKWQGKVVSAGTSAFSEPEAQALRDFLSSSSTAAAIFWHSQSNAVYASECNDGVLPSDMTLMNTYAQAAGYPAVESFNAYPVTGDAEGWLASIGIPAITVELKTHKTVEWDKNLLGIKAVLNLYGAN